jgi:hypothetical protein
MSPKLTPEELAKVRRAAGERAIEKLRAERAADLRDWVMIKHKLRNKDDTDKDAIRYTGYGETKIRQLMKAGIIQYRKSRLNLDSIFALIEAETREDYGLAEPEKPDGRRKTLARGRKTMAGRRRGGASPPTE